MKYIVYKTTNLVNKYIYIGVHKTVNPYKFDGYLGCGVNCNRPTSYMKSKTAFQKAVCEYGPKNFFREIISVFDIKEEAYLLEELLVNENFLARPDVYNMILGGNINCTEGKAVYQYATSDGSFIKGYASCQEAAAAVHCNPRTISRGVTELFTVCGYYFSFYQLPKIDITLFNPKQPQKVYRYLQSGEFDQAFESLTSAGAASLNSSAVFIQKAATLGYLVKDTYYFSFIKELSYDKARTEQNKMREVFLYDSDGNFVEQYATQQEAERKWPNCNITRSIKFRQADSNGHYWALVKVPVYNRPVHHTAKQVAQIDNDGSIIKTWPSSNACAKEVGPAVKNVLQGKYQKHKGFIYKYIDN